LNAAWSIERPGKAPSVMTLQTPRAGTNDGAWSNEPWVQGSGTLAKVRIDICQNWLGKTTCMKCYIILFIYAVVDAPCCTHNDKPTRDMDDDCAMLWTIWTWLIMSLLSTLSFAVI
jgi:hypothetical protein